MLVMTRYILVRVSYINLSLGGGPVLVVHPRQGFIHKFIIRGVPVLVMTRYILVRVSYMNLSLGGVPVLVMTITCILY